MKNMKQARQQGFTLIELMIVIAIVGILSAVALPAYQDYTVRAKFSEVLATAGSAKTSYTEYVAATGLKPTDENEAGISESSNLISGITASATAITITLDTTATGFGDTSLAGNVVFTPTFASATDFTITSWVCSTTVVAAEWGKLPSNCRRS
ncbi:MAG: pilin [Halieaceae bacterium]|nr:pilin [Halieaceae bacterium]